MTKIICRASDCVYWDDGACTTEEITYDPEQGCLTFESIDEVLIEDEEEWEDDGILDDEELDWDAEDDDLLDLEEDELVDDWNV